MIVRFYTLVFCILSFVCISCSDGDDSPVTEKPGTDNPGGNGEFDPGKVGLEYDDGTNIAFQVKLAVDKEGYDMRDLEFFKSRLKIQWEAINERFNKLDKQKGFKRNYIFIPDLEDIVIYERDEEKELTDPGYSHWNVHNLYPTRIDKSKYQCMVVYDFVVQEGEGGGGYGDDGAGMGNILVINPSKENIGKFFNHLDENTSTVAAIVHELGHFRGIEDIYPLSIGADKNPISNQGFTPIAGIMNNPYPSIDKCEWSGYEINCINACGAKKGWRMFDHVMADYMADYIEVNVTEDGESVEGFQVNFYIFKDGKVSTEKKAQMSIEGSKYRKDARELFWYGDYTNDKSLWTYHKMFLVEVISDKTGKKGYQFLPFYEPHNQGLMDKYVNPISGKSVFVMNIDIKNK